MPQERPKYRRPAPIPRNGSPAHAPSTPPPTPAPSPSNGDLVPGPTETSVVEDSPNQADKLPTPPVSLPPAPLPPNLQPDKIHRQAVRAKTAYLMFRRTLNYNNIIPWNKLPQDARFSIMAALARRFDDLRDDDPLLQGIAKFAPHTTTRRATRMLAHLYGFEALHAWLATQGAPALDSPPETT